MKALFFGLGGVGQRHLRNFLVLRPDAEIAAVRHVGRRFEVGPDLRADTTTDIVSKYNVRVFTSADDAITQFAPDIAIIASPTSAHAAQALPVINAAIPLLLEKPATAHRDELEVLLTAQRTSGSLVMMAYMLRFHPSVRRLEQAIRAGVIGRINTIAMEANSFLPSWHPYEGIKDFYAGRADLGGGVVLTESHMTDLLFWLFGAPRRLWSVGGNLSDYGMDVEDTATTLMEYDIDGRKIAASLTQCFVQRPPRFTMAIKGENGRIDWSLLEGRLIIENCQTNTRDVFETPNFERNTMFMDEMTEFLECAITGRQPEATLDRAAGAEKILHAVKRSLSSGSIEVPA